MALIVTYDLTLQNMTKLSRHFTVVSVFGNCVQIFITYTIYTLTERERFDGCNAFACKLCHIAHIYARLPSIISFKLYVNTIKLQT